jgi:hypothetical protein
MSSLTISDARLPSSDKQTAPIPSERSSALAGEIRRRADTPSYGSLSHRKNEDARAAVSGHNNEIAVGAHRQLDHWSDIALRGLATLSRFRCPTWAQRAEASLSREAHFSSLLLPNRSIRPTYALLLQPTR